ncbi:MAG: PLP-dependent aminotransferase family protein [Clostridia bacterium]|nr:PLP-dependent aminotransferase family protein [Clostridia bacterium]
MSQIQFASRMDGINGSAIRDIFHLLRRPGIISFAGGNPAPSAFEPETLARLADEVLTASGRTILQYGATEGYAPLKESTAEYLKTAGIECTSDAILPVTGSTQGMDLVTKVLINPGDTILVEAPTFLGTLQAMQIYQANLVPCKMDEDGLDIEALEETIRATHPKLLYVIPNFQNPTGRTLALSRRQKIAELAAKYDFFVIEDDPYRDLRYRGDALPTIKSFDTAGHVIYCSSYSKVISPGMRVGAIVVSDPTLMRKIVIAKQSSDLHTSNLDQALVDAYLRHGYMPEHLVSIRASYTKQLDAMLDGFRFFPEGVKNTVPDGGMFVWVTLPEAVNAVNLLNQAIEANVAYVPGTHFYPVPGTNLNTLRLNFTNASEETITKGMKALGDVVRNAL